MDSQTFSDSSDESDLDYKPPGNCKLCNITFEKFIGHDCFIIYEYIFKVF